MIPTISNSTTKINLESYINSLLWEKRIVLFISKAKYVHFINETDDFFKNNSCENEARNLKYIRIVGDEINKYVMPDRYTNKYGIWLIGYDGMIKDFSNDDKIYLRLFDLIDSMPMRKDEMINDKC